MKKIIFGLAAAALLGVSCSDSDQNNEEPDKPTSGLAAPEVTFVQITETSFSASWPAVEGAEEYRYEVTTEIGGTTKAIAADYTPATTLTIDALTPLSEYKVRIAARAGGETSRNWFSGTVTTLGASDIAFTITPCEKYHSSGYVYPFARVTPSNPDIYYWVSAVPADQMTDAASWIQEDINYYLSEGYTWDDLLEAGLICQGEAESALFSFADYGDFVFAAAAISKTMSGFQLLSEPSFSYVFWTESLDTPMQHVSTFEDFTGEWVLTTAGTTTLTGDNMLEIAAGEIFPVTIKAGDDGKSFELTGWGGDRNRYSSHALKLDYQAADDGYNKFTISFPQQITEEDNITWEYASWFVFNGTIEGQQQSLYMPYDSGTAETIPAWAVGFSGFVANLNKTVLKIFGQEYTDPSTTGEGAYMMGIWPIGHNAAGELVQLNASYGEPISLFYLTRKDVAEGKVYELPEVSQTGSTAARVSTAALHKTGLAAQQAENPSGMCFRRVR